MYGNWSDSDAIDEAKLFLTDFGAPNLHDCLQILDSLPKDTPIRDIINSLSQEIDQYHLSLLQYILQIRFFHPKAASLFPTSRHQSPLGGYFIHNNCESPQFNQTSFNQKILSYAQSLHSDDKKFSFFNTLGTNFTNIASFLGEYSIDPTLSVPNLNESKGLIFTLNGAEVSPDFFSVTERFLHEHKIARAAELFGENPMLYDTIEEPFYYTKQQQNIYGAILRDTKSKFNDAPKNWKWDSPIYDFLKNPVIHMSVYIYPSSIKSLSMLHYIFEKDRVENPITTQVYCLAHPGNATEEYICTAFHSLNINEGARSAALYLYDGLKTNFPRAYRKAVPTLPWKKVKKNKAAVKRVLEMQKYQEEMNMTDSMMFINGQPVFDEPQFHYAEKTVWEVAERIKKHKGEINKDIRDWSDEHGVHYKGVYPPFMVQEHHFVSLDDLSFDSIVNLVKEIASLEIIHQNGSQLVICIDHKPQTFPRGAIVLYADSSKQSSLFRQVFRTYTPRTVVGPYNFDFIVEDWDYAMELLEKTVHTVLPVPFEAVILRNLRLSHDRSKRITRKKGSSIVPIKVNEGCPVTLHIEIDPYSGEYPQYMAITNLLYKHLLATFEFVCLLDPRPSNTVPKGLQQFTTYGLETGLAYLYCTYTLRTPPSWGLLHRESLTIEVTSIYASAYTKPGHIFKLGDNEMISHNHNGYFSLPAVPGPVQTQGFSQAFVLTSFVPSSRYYEPSEYAPLPTPSKPFFVLLYNDYNLPVAVYSILSQTSENVSVFVLSNTAVGGFKSRHFTVIPDLHEPWMHFHDWHLARFVLPCLSYFRAGNVLVNDPSIVWETDIGAFRDIKMGSNALIVPELCSDKKCLKKVWWGNNRFQNSRMGRPYLNGGCVFVDLENFHAQDGIEKMHKAACYASDGFDVQGSLAFQLATYVQLELQTLIIDDSVAYFFNDNLEERGERAVSVMANYEYPRKFLKTPYAVWEQKAREFAE